MTDDTLVTTQLREPIVYDCTGDNAMKRYLYSNCRGRVALISFSSFSM